MKIPRRRMRRYEGCGGRAQSAERGAMLKRGCGCRGC
ncbi:hypothetical protein ES332_D03G042100v1 [Gossypium tomentosum]|uniref:Uncharacterized protein n=1 Tax=Gossypium tomentosum TaxID=34277 RepID=A0A5D2LJA2_GOSTO|nr:hypothetical protein ES332_D03G042100v1 [Gossypium tomentosum]